MKLTHFLLLASALLAIVRASDSDGEPPKRSNGDDEPSLSNTKEASAKEEPKREEPEVDINAVMSASVSWPSKGEHKLVYGKDNELAVSLTNSYSEPITVFTVTGVLSTPGKPSSSRPLPPQRILTAAPPNKTTSLPFKLRPELEPGKYKLEVTVEVITPKVIRLHKLPAYTGEIVIHDPHARILDIQTIVIIVVFSLLALMLIPFTRRSILGLLWADSKSRAAFKRSDGEPKEEDWLPAHVKAQERISSHERLVSAKRRTAAK